QGCGAALHPPSRRGVRNTRLPEIDRPNIGWFTAASRRRILSLSLLWGWENEDSGTVGCACAYLTRATDTGGRSHARALAKGFRRSDDLCDFGLIVCMIWLAIA